MNAEKHRRYTGQSNKKILENLRRFCEVDKNIDVIVRTPVIPGCNDERENFLALAEFLNTLERVPKVEILPYNPLAGAKHPRLGMEYALKVEESDGNSPEELSEILTNHGIEAKVVR